MYGKIKSWLFQPCISFLTKDRPYEGIPLCDFERIRYEVRPCDILLIEGRSEVSDIIRSITQSSWSHAALYIGRIHEIEDPKLRNLLATHFPGPPDSQLIIEGMMGRGTIVNNIAYYANDHVRVCRARGLTRTDAQKVIEYAVHKVGTEYDIRHILDLARFLVPWTIIPRRFRSRLFEYNPGENTKTVCSSMIAEAFDSVNFPILPLVKTNAEDKVEFIARNPKLCTPRDFDYSPYFDIIKYPLVEFDGAALYHKPPWNKEGVMHHDKAGIRPLHKQKIKKKRTSVIHRIHAKFKRPNDPANHLQS